MPDCYYGNFGNELKVINRQINGQGVLTWLTKPLQLVLYLCSKIVIMNIEQQLHERSGSVCELSGTAENLKVYEIPYSPAQSADTAILINENLISQLENPDTMIPNEWRFLNESIWSSVPAVQVVSWRALQWLKNEGWAADILDMAYLEDEVLAWAKAGIQEEENQIVHRDSNGAVLENGDTVVLIKDLDVKGSSLVAKRGTAVRRISLVHDNPEQIEGRVEGQQIVILTKFVKKSG